MENIGGIVLAIPTLNEEEHVESVIRTLNASAIQALGEPVPIWVLDGGSRDSTVSVVESIGLENVRLINNPYKTQSHAINIAAEMASEERVEFLVRIDAHAVYRSDFIQTLVEAIIETGADSIVVPLETVGGNLVQSAAAILYNSWLGNGGSPHRSGKVRGFVDHGHHAAFRLRAFQEIGGYDTNFAANEDAEFDYRFVARGYSVFLENRSPVGYIPRPSLPGYWKQMRRNGRFRVQTALKHRIPLGLRQILPLMIVPGLVAAATLGFFLHPVFWSGVVVYALLVLGLSTQATVQSEKPSITMAITVATIAAISHTAFSLGGLQRLGEAMFIKK